MYQWCLQTYPRIGWQIVHNFKKSTFCDVNGNDELLVTIAYSFVEKTRKEKRVSVESARRFPTPAEPLPVQPYAEYHSALVSYEDR